MPARKSGRSRHSARAGPTCWRKIYPSLIEPNPGHEVKDARQVDAFAAALQKLDELGELKRHLRAPSQMPAAVREEEGLILGMQDQTGLQRAARAGS